jgi:transcriptional regulator with XRE-family HTH domain
VVTQSLDERIAQRIRRRREELGHSLERLAELSGVSRSMLSRIERAESSPTATLLLKVCDALGLTLSGVMADVERAPFATLRRSEQVTWRDPESGYVRRNISPAMVGSTLEIVEIELPAGARVVFDDTTRLAYDHEIYVLDGELTMQIGDRTVTLERGDCLHTLENVGGYQNRSAQTARYLVVLTTHGRVAGRSDRVAASEDPTA